MLKDTFNLLPQKFKKKSLIFVFMLMIATFFEMIGVGLIFPLIDLIVNDGFTKNLFGINLIEISQIYNKEDIIYYFFISFLVLILIKSSFLIYFSYWNNKFSQNLYKQLSENLLQIYINKNIDFYFNRNSSELLRNVIMECKNVGGMVLCYLRLIVEIVVSIGIIIIIFYIDQVISILTLIIFLFFTSIYYFFVKRIIYNYGLIRQSTSNSQIKILKEVFDGIKDIKLKSIESFFLSIYYKTISQFINAAFKSNTLIEIPKILIELIFIIIISIIVLVNFALSSDILKIFPIIGLYTAAAFKLMPSISKILSLFQTIEGAKPSTKLLKKEFNIKRDKQNLDYKDTGLKNIEITKFLELQNINFSYNPKNELNEKKGSLFENLSFRIKKNSFVGIIGKSGQGKSTIIDLITGILKPLQGRVMVDDIDIQTNTKSWQKNIGYVSQSIFLIDSSIKKNIALGLDEDQIDNDQIIQCCKDAMILEYINQLDNKFETNIGENGIKLSGGQIQRLAIARELYRKPKVLILDEATSGLDEKTENEILSFLEKIRGKITVIIVSHRKNTLKNCDSIIDLAQQ